MATHFRSEDQNSLFAKAQAEALTQALPAAVRARRMIILTCVMVAVVALAIAFMSLGQGEGGRVLAGFAAGVGAVVILVLIREIHRKQEKIILPILCQTLGLEHKKSPQGFLSTLPRDLIPLGGIQQVDDVISGSINGHDFSFAEVVTQHAKKLVTPEFRGIVLTMCKSNRPSLLVALDQETQDQPDSPARIQTKNMMRLGSFRVPNGGLMGLWVPKSGPVDDISENDIAAFRQLAEDVQSVLDGAELYSIRVADSGLFVAIRMNRDLFRLAGPTADEIQLIQSINAMSADLALPGLLAEQVVQTSYRPPERARMMQ